MFISEWQVGKKTVCPKHWIQPSQFFVFNFLSLRFKFSVHPCILCCLIAFPPHPFAYFLTSGYLPPSNSRKVELFSISLKRSSYRESTVYIFVSENVPFFLVPISRRLRFQFQKIKLVKDISECSITGKTLANSQNAKKIGRPLFGLIFPLIIFTKNTMPNSTVKYL